MAGARPGQSWSALNLSQGVAQQREQGMTVAQLPCGAEPWKQMVSEFKANNLPRCRKAQSNLAIISVWVDH